MIALVRCAFCGGRGERDFYACPHCDGTGLVSRAEGDHLPAPRPLSIAFSADREAEIEQAVDDGDAARVFVLAHLDDGNGGRAA